MCITVSFRPSLLLISSPQKRLLSWPVSLVDPMQSSGLAETSLLPDSLSQFCKCVFKSPLMWSKHADPVTVFSLPCPSCLSLCSRDLAQCLAHSRRSVNVSYHNRASARHVVLVPGPELCLSRPSLLALDLPAAPFGEAAEAGFYRASSGLHTRPHTVG